MDGTLINSDVVCLAVGGATGVVAILVGFKTEGKSIGVCPGNNGAMLLGLVTYG